MTTSDELLQQGRAAANASDWQTAATCLQSGLRADPGQPPRWYFLLGQALEQLRDLPGSAAAYGMAIERRKNVPAEWHFRYAEVLGRLKDWERSVAQYETAIDRLGADLTPDWFYRLGLAYEHLRCWADVTRAYRTALTLAPDATDAEWRMLEREAREFPGRRSTLRFVQRHLSEIQAGAAQSLATGADRTRVIYSYWAQGYDAAPEIVQRCHQRLLAASSDPVLTLDEPAMTELVTLPADIEARGIAPTHRTDLLRLELLARYGGSWLDATCWVTEDPVPALLDLRQQSGYFAFAKRRSSLATWLMTSTPDHYLVRMLRAGLHCFWRHHATMRRYFTLHYIFEALTELDETFGELWRATPEVRFDQALRLRWKFDQPYDPETYQQTLDASFVHKLTYKFDRPERGQDTVLAHLLETM